MEEHSFKEVMKQFKRSCPDGQCSSATDCAMYPASNIGQCRKIAFERPAEFERRVMEWAESHPEPEYPTWLEWLQKEGLYIRNEIEVGVYFTSVTAKAFEPIPADIAERLGIKPKEG